tara:strand:+ start:2622 stop:3290 length:669 start_codon:yes stop_codon:yes gene_type:complete
MSITPETLQKEYQLRFGHLAEYRKSVWQILCSDFFSKYVSSDARVLDLGAGWCEFINNVTASQKYAMDLNPDTEKRIAPGTSFLHQDCSAEWKLERESLDVVFTSNFLEHLPDKAGVTRTISQAYQCLAPGGCLICLGPNIKYLNGSYWDFYDHYVPLTELAVGELLQLEGFEVELSVDRFLPYSMSQGSAPPLFLLRWYLKLEFLWRFAGKQFLVIGRKKK